MVRPEPWIERAFVMTTTLANSSTIDALIGGFRSHLLGRPLPAPAMLTFLPKSGEVCLQPEGGLDFSRRLGNVLLWAYTLADITARWAHTESGRLHVQVLGRTSSGIRFEVYAGCEFSECHGLVSLRLGESEGVSLDELYTLAGLLRDAQHEREAA
jgi:hypothetical protein